MCTQEDVVLPDVNNPSGIHPVGYFVLVEPEVVPERTSKGGIYLPQVSRDMEKKGSRCGRIIDIGSLAWRAFDEEKKDPWAKIGDKVTFARYAGSELTGIDGKKYIVLNDKDIMTRCADDFTIIGQDF